MNERQLHCCGWWYTVHIPAQSWTISLLRATLRMALDRHERPDLADTACLLTTELVTNGIVHAKSPVTVDFRWEAETFHVDVHDTNPAGPAQRRASHEDEAGRGLTLVESCATDWGVRLSTQRPGKTVWFTLR